ncbi:diphthamide synthesis protein [Candidatus Woesearchaeota archaeon]|nr:diphthamide synthesis protein [Candidatus Woesearchaeota archaeon]
MKTLFIHAKSNIDVELPKAALAKLPANVGIVTNVQHLHKIKDAAAQLEAAGKKAIVAGQVLGCNAWNAVNIKGKVDCFLFVGSGVFHPIQVELATGKPVFTWNPFSEKFQRLPKEEIDSYHRRRKAALNKFLHADRVGIIVSTKAGQLNLRRALELAKQKPMGKSYYIFVCDELHMQELENFPDIQCWVNTACPRIADDSKHMLNIDELSSEGFIKFPSTAAKYDIPIWMDKKGLAKRV